MLEAASLIQPQWQTLWVRIYRGLAVDFVSGCGGYGAVVPASIVTMVSKKMGGRRFARWTMRSDFLVIFYGGVETSNYLDDDRHLLLDNLSFRMYWGGEK
jgi:hypothetical protein